MEEEEEEGRDKGPCVSPFDGAEERGEGAACWQTGRIGTTPSSPYLLVLIGSANELLIRTSSHCRRHDQTLLPSQDPCSFCSQLHIREDHGIFVLPCIPLRLHSYHPSAFSSAQVFTERVTDAVARCSVE